MKIIEMKDSKLLINHQVLLIQINDEFNEMEDLQPQTLK